MIRPCFFTIRDKYSRFLQYFMTKNLDRDSLDFRNEKIGRLFRALFFPTLVGMIFNSLLTLIDGIFVGQGVGPNGIAAVNIVAPLYMVCSGVGLMLGIGASVVASIRLAQNDVKASRVILTQSFFTGMSVITVVMLACMTFTRPIVYALGSSVELEQNASDYLFWMGPCLFAFMPMCIGMMLIRLDGSPNYAMWIQITGAALNIFLDWVFIFPLGMGVKGAAIATSISTIVAGSMVFAYFIFLSDKLKFCRIKISLTSFLSVLHSVGYMIKIGFATFLIEIAMSVTMLTGNYVFMSLQGEQGVAAFSIACYLFPVVFSIANAVALSAQPIISYNYGANLNRRVGKALRVAMATAVMCGLIISAGVWLGAPAIVSAFLRPGAEACEIAVRGLPLFGTCAAFFAVNVTFIGYYQSVERPMPSTIFALLRGIIFLIPSFLILPRLLGATGPWMAITSAELLTMTVIIIYYFINRRRTSAVPNKYLS